MNQDQKIILSEFIIVIIVLIQLLLWIIFLSTLNQRELDFINHWATTKKTVSFHIRTKKWVVNPSLNLYNMVTLVNPTVPNLAQTWMISFGKPNSSRGGLWFTLWKINLLTLKMTNLQWKLVFQPRQLPGSMLIYQRLLLTCRKPG